MACPYTMYRIDWETDKHLFRTEKLKRFIIDDKVTELPVYENIQFRVHNGGILLGEDEFRYIQQSHPGLGPNVQKVPCGKCIQCRLNYSREWANRCVLESRFYEHNAFVTLTYDNEHLFRLPWKLDYDEEKNEFFRRPSLLKDDVQKFLKDLRSYFKYHFDHDGIRHFAAGEYGDEGGRPHFHVILFNCDFPDKRFFKENEGGRLYTSEILDKIWKKGIAVTAEVNWNSAAYTARYCMKKLKGKDKKKRDRIFELAGFEGDHIEDEFSIKSNRPGIGRNYYDANKSIFYATDEIFVKKGDKAQAIRPAKYYDRLYDVEYPDEMAAIKARRRLTADRSLRSELSYTDMTERELLLMKEDIALQKSNKLIRPLDIGN